MATNVAKPDKIPAVVRFAYSDLVIDKSDSKKWKWSAKCNNCVIRITETFGTTTGFTKHLSRNHNDIYKQYNESKGKKFELD